MIVNLYSNFLEILGKIGLHLIQMIKVHSFIIFNMLNDATPDRFCMFSFSRLNPYSYDKRMYDFFSWFHSESVYFSFGTPLSMRGWEDKVLAQQKMLLQNNSTIHYGSHIFITPLSQKNQKSFDLPCHFPSSAFICPSFVKHLG